MSGRAGGNRRAKVKIITYVLGLILFLSEFAYAQDTGGIGEDEEKKIEEIIVEADPLLGRLKGDLKAAFAAFKNGEYALAEIQFKKLEKTQLQAFLAESAGLRQILCSQRVTCNFRTNFASKHYMDNAAAVLSYMRGVSQARQGKFAEAQLSFEEALDIDKSYHDARIDLAMVTILAGDTGSAEPHMKRLRRTMRRCSRDCESLTARYAKLDTLYQTALDSGDQE